MNIFRPLACAALLALGLPTHAQQTPAPKVEQAKEPEPDVATLRAMKSKVFEVKYRSPLWLSNSLRALGSGVRGSRLDWTSQDGLNLLTVRDFPENVAAIEEALKRLDAPAATQMNPDVELHVHVLLASKQPIPGAALPDELVEVVRSLKDTLTYKSYTLAASFVQRVQIQADRRVDGRGMLDAKTYGSDPTKDASVFQVDWQFQGGALDIPKEGSVQIRLREFSLALREKSSTNDQTMASLRTDVAFKEGEKVVVGTSVVKDKGLIVVLTARRVN